MRLLLNAVLATLMVGVCQGAVASCLGPAGTAVNCTSPDNEYCLG